MHPLKLFSLCLSLSLWSCCAPQECRPARIGFKLYTPIADALENYKTDHGSYPESLDVLIPLYLEKIPEHTDPNRPTKALYKKNFEGFTLNFRYGGPGINNCEYNSKSKTWKCEGHY